MNGDDMNNTDMNLSITEMMELILTGANGSELAVEGVMLNAIDHIKKLEEQNELMLSILKDIDTQIKVGYDVYNILTPETISDISSIITDIEEQKEEENQ